MSKPLTLFQKSQAFLSLCLSLCDSLLFLTPFSSSQDPHSLALATLILRPLLLAPSPFDTSNLIVDLTRPATAATSLGSPLFAPSQPHN